MALYDSKDHFDDADNLNFFTVMFCFKERRNSGQIAKFFYKQMKLFFFYFRISFLNTKFPSLSLADINLLNAKSKR